LTSLMPQRREKDYKCALRWQTMMEDKLLEEAVVLVAGSRAYQPAAADSP
jgi:hypothetical protein